MLRIDWEAESRSGSHVGSVFVAGVDEADVQAWEACAAVWAGQIDLTAIGLDRWEQIPIHQSARQVSVYASSNIASPSHGLPFPVLLLRRGWQDRVALDVAQCDPINRHDLIVAVSRRLVRSDGFCTTPRFREIELGTVGLEEPGIRTQAMLVRLP